MAVAGTTQEDTVDIAFKSVTWKSPGGLPFREATGTRTGIAILRVDIGL